MFLQRAVFPTSCPPRLSPAPSFRKVATLSVLQLTAGTLTVLQPGSETHLYRCHDSLPGQMTNLTSSFSRYVPKVTKPVFHCVCALLKQRSVPLGDCSDTCMLFLSSGQVLCCVWRICCLPLSNYCILWIVHSTNCIQYYTWWILVSKRNQRRNEN